MAFVKVIRKFKGCKAKLGEILIVDDGENLDEINGKVKDTEGNEYPTHCIAPLTEEEAAKHLHVETIDIG